MLSTLFSHYINQVKIGEFQKGQYFSLFENKKNSMDVTKTQRGPVLHPCILRELN